MEGKNPTTTLGKNIGTHFMASEKHEVNEQRLLPLSYPYPQPRLKGSYVERLTAIVSGNLDFHHTNSRYATHVIHSFPAKFPPQLPRLFINELTRPGDIVLDPMMGSGTTLVEASLAGREGIGVDIDPLALRIAKVKTAPIDTERIVTTLQSIMKTTKQRIADADEETFLTDFEAAFDTKTQKFIRYWFAPQTAKALFYLSRAIADIPDPTLRLFFEVAFSSIIITKRGGVSLALDLAHTRPHRAKIVIDEEGNTILHSDNVSPRRLHVLTKQLRPVLSEFERRVQNNMNSLLALKGPSVGTHVLAGDARQMPLADHSVDLIVTSPPYVANAIDYMRAHKFSLVWFGCSVNTLGAFRRKYIGSETKVPTSDRDFPSTVRDILERLAEQDTKKMQAVRRYYTEMRDVLREMWRVLKPGKAALVVVGTSIIRGIDIQIADCLAELGRDTGFTVPAVGVRNLDRNRRMLPTGTHIDTSSQIQQRMHQEFVLAFYKPAT